MVDFPRSVIERLVTPLYPGFHMQTIDDGEAVWAVTAEWRRCADGYLHIVEGTVSMERV